MELARLSTRSKQQRRRRRRSAQITIIIIYNAMHSYGDAASGNLSRDLCKCQLCHSGKAAESARRAALDGPDKAMKRPHGAFEPALPENRVSNKPKLPNEQTASITLNSKSCLSSNRCSCWSNESESLKVWCAQSCRGGCTLKVRI